MTLPKAADKGFAVESLELLKLGAIDQAGDDLTGVDESPEVLGEETIQLLGIVGGWAGWGELPGQVFLYGDAGYDFPCDGDGLFVVGGVVVGDA